MRRTLACLAFAVMPALAAAGCGQDKLDTSGLESKIGETLGDRTGAKVESVVCPDEVEAKKGASFRCTATTKDRERVVVTVTQEDDEGAVTWKINRR